MHAIESAAIPPVIKTAISGVSTPSSIGQVLPGPTVVEENAQALDEWKQSARFAVEWVDFRGNDRQFGYRSGGISADNVVRLIRLLSTRGTTVFNVVKVSG